MNLAWWLTNLVEYSLQAALLAVVGGVLLYSFRIRDPGVRLPYWQFLLTACPRSAVRSTLAEHVVGLLFSGGG